MAHVIHEVQPGFNMTGIETINQGRSPVSMDIFDPATRLVLESGDTFTLVLGSGFNTPAVTGVLISMPCAGVASIEQLDFLKNHGLTSIQATRNHPTLVENATSLGIPVTV